MNPLEPKPPDLFLPVAYFLYWNLPSSSLTQNCQNLAEFYALVARPDSFIVVRSGYSRCDSDAIHELWCFLTLSRDSQPASATGSAHLVVKIVNLGLFFAPTYMYFHRFSFRLVLVTEQFRGGLGPETSQSVVLVKSCSISLQQRPCLFASAEWRLKTQCSDHLFGMGCEVLMGLLGFGIGSCWGVQAGVTIICCHCWLFDFCLFYGIVCGGNCGHHAPWSFQGLCSDCLRASIGCAIICVRLDGALLPLWSPALWLQRFRYDFGTSGGWRCVFSLVLPLCFLPLWLWRGSCCASSVDCSTVASLLWPYGFDVIVQYQLSIFCLWRGREHILHHGGLWFGDTVIAFIHQSWIHDQGLRNDAWIAMAPTVHAPEFQDSLVLCTLCLHLGLLWAYFSYGNSIWWPVDMDSYFDHLYILFHQCNSCHYFMYLLNLLLCLLRGMWKFLVGFSRGPA